MWKRKGSKSEKIGRVAAEQDFKSFSILGVGQGSMGLGSVSIPINSIGLLWHVFAIGCGDFHSRVDGA